MQDLDILVKSLENNIQNLADPNLSVSSQQPSYCKNKTRSIKPNMLVTRFYCFCISTPTQQQT